MKTLKLKLRQEQIEIEDLKGDTQTYTLQELTGHEREQYMTKMGTRMKWDKDGKPAGMSTFEGSMTNLVEMSLRDAEGRRVNPEVLKQWPQSVVEELYTLASGLSALGKTEEEKEKNA